MRVVLLIAVVAAAFLVLSPSASAQSDCSAAEVTVLGDSCGTTVSVAIYGNAEGQDCSGLDTCITVAPVGHASNHGGDQSCGHESVGCVAVSGTGDASNQAGDSSCGFFRGAGCVAVSGTGSASNDAGYFGCGQVGVGCIAVSGTGTADNTAGSNGCGPGVACIAVSGTNHAQNHADSCGGGVSCLEISGGSSSPVSTDHFHVDDSPAALP